MQNVHLSSGAISEKYNDEILEKSSKTLVLDPKMTKSPSFGQNDFPKKFETVTFINF